MRTMKRILVGLALSAVTALVIAPADLRGHGNERGTAEATLQGGNVAIEYGRPTLKGRDVLSLIRPGSYWRLGADQATTLVTDVGLTLGDGGVVGPGKYVLLLKYGGEDSWSLVVANGASRGSEPQGVVAEVALHTARLDASVEALTIKLSSEENRGTLTIEWGETQMVTGFVAA